ncbi:NAD(P)H-dependent oxidoreductase [Streptomyces sp. H49]|uniref:NAD(P)H-dependent oxidoreductase n=1 Tax=Streptomyces sp. H49 TaxID=3444117 RepID=UPI003F4AF696
MNGFGTLVVWAHPNRDGAGEGEQPSRVGAALARAARDVSGVRVHDLYRAHPDGVIDVPAEQRLLTAHRRIVLQFPFYWYSVPPLLKRWLDDVLEHGFAYGSEGTALRGRTLQVVTTTGGPASSYGPDGYNRFTIRELLRPLEATANLCGMDFPAPFVVHGTRTLTDADLAAEAARYRTLLASPALPSAA